MTDPGLVRLLVGDGREALPVARDAARLAPDDTDAVLSLVSANMAVKRARNWRK